MRRPRHLSPEERALWNKVAERTDPLGPTAPAPSPPPKKPNRKPTNGADTPKPIPEFRVGSSVDHSADHDLMPSLSQQLSASPIRMDKKVFGKMKRGKVRPEARLDLHGMVLAEAQPALVSFIMQSHAAGHRLVLVITGKGKNTDDGGPIPTRFGKLRHQVPVWLRQAPLSSLVLQVTEAHRTQGGSGALYVYLARSR